MATQIDRVVVVGGGAAGFFGAIACASAYPQTQVILLEAGRQLLSKVRISGGGRCNVTHACFEPALLVQNYPRGGKALRGPFSRFQPRDTIAWFADQGVELKTEADGRMFPTTDDSETIVDCLLYAAKDAGVIIRTGAPVRAITPVEAPRSASGSGFEVQLKSGESILCDRVLLATGSQPHGYELARSLGHQIEPPVPSLFTFNLRDPRLQALAGISVRSAHLQLQTPDGQKFAQTGPLLITHWGLSGPAVLKLSAWGARALHDSRYQGTLRINWLPDNQVESVRQLLLSIKAQLPNRAIATHPAVILPRRLWEYLLTRTGIRPDLRWAELPNKLLNQLLQELTQGTYAITGKGVFKEEFVTCGGVNLKEIDFKTLQSRCCPNLYFAGEILDIDGITGGFNFQSAWTTGWLAGQSMGKS